MTMLVLTEADVRVALDMPSCIEAMEDVLAGLTRGELSMPLRTVVKPPGRAAFGLMPAHRTGESPLFSLKEIVVVPHNSERGLDPHQGAVLLHDGTTGQLLAVLNASPITEIRTAAVSGVATKLLAPPGSKEVAIVGAGIQGRSHAIAMRAVLPDAELRIWSRNPAHAEALALEAHGLPCATLADALDGADVVCTCTAAREAFVPRDLLARGAHVNAVGASLQAAGELEPDVIAAATLFADRRESVVNEAGDFKQAAERFGLGPEHIKAELGELLIGLHPGRTSPEELTVFRSLGLAVEDLAAAEVAVRRARELGLGIEVEF